MLSGYGVRLPQPRGLNVKSQAAMLKADFDP